MITETITTTGTSAREDDAGDLARRLFAIEQDPLGPGDTSVTTETRHALDGGVLSEPTGTGVANAAFVRALLHGDDRDDRDARDDGQRREISAEPIPPVRTETPVGQFLARVFGSAGDDRFPPGPPSGRHPE